MTRGPNYTNVMHEVSRVLETFSVLEPPVDPADIARKMGINVIFAGFRPELQNIAGFYDFEDNSIFVNKDEFPLRQNFTIAHELGHSILHSEWAKSAEYKILLRNDGSNSEDPFEKEANAFAAHLLVPRYMLDKYWRNLSYEQLSKLFAVSVPMIQNRISFEYGV